MSIQRPIALLLAWAVLPAAAAYGQLPVFADDALSAPRSSTLPTPGDFDEPSARVDRTTRTENLAAPWSPDPEASGSTVLHPALRNRAFPSACRECISGQCCPKERRHTQITTGVWLGELTGHLQTPVGGNPGTTSSHRPTVSEIGLDGPRWMPTIDARLDIEAGHELHVNYVHIDRSGDERLDELLVSNGFAFPGGSNVDSTFGLDTFRFGYRPRFCCNHLLGGRLVPEIGVGVTALEYGLSSFAADAQFNRSYHVGFPYVGVLLEQPLTERCRLELDVAGSGGINRIAFVDGELRAAYRLTSRRGWNAWAVVGWRGMWFRRHDGQAGEQNDPNVRLGALSDDPWAGLTLAVRFGY